MLGDLMPSYVSAGLLCLAECSMDFSWIAVLNQWWMQYGDLLRETRH